MTEDLSIEHADRNTGKAIIIDSGGKIGLVAINKMISTVTWWGVLMKAKTLVKE